MMNHDLADFRRNLPHYGNPQQNIATWDNHTGLEDIMSNISTLALSLDNNKYRSNLREGLLGELTGEGKRNIATLSELNKKLMETLQGENKVGFQSMGQALTEQLKNAKDPRYNEFFNRLNNVIPSFINLFAGLRGYNAKQLYAAQQRGEFPSWG